MPAEWLPRQPGRSFPDTLPPRAGSSRRPGPGSYAPVTDAIVEVFSACRTAEMSSAPADLHSPAAAVDNLKGYCFFLDTDLVGVTELSDHLWHGDPIDGHDRAVAIAVADRRPAGPGEPGEAWVAGAERLAAEIRAMEVATVVTRYLGAIGYSATAHTHAASDVDLDRVALEAGVVEIAGGRLTNPCSPGRAVTGWPSSPPTWPSPSITHWPTGLVGSICRSRLAMPSATAAPGRVSPGSTVAIDRGTSAGTRWRRSSGSIARPP